MTELELLISNKKIDNPVILDTVEKIYRQTTKLNLDKYFDVDQTYENLSTFNICKNENAEAPLIKYDWEKNDFLVNPEKDDDCDYEFHFAKEMLLLLINDRQKAPGLNEYDELSSFDEGIRSNIAELLVGDASKNKSIEDNKVIANLAMIGSDLDALLKSYFKCESINFVKQAKLDKKIVQLTDYNDKYSNETNRSLVGEIQDDRQGTLYSHLVENGVSDTAIKKIMEDFEKSSINNKHLMDIPEKYETVDASSFSANFDINKTKVA